MEQYMVVGLPCVMMAVDVITGYIAAMFNNSVDSTRLKKGLYGKLGEVVAIIVGFIAQYAILVFGDVPLGFQVDMPIGITVCAYIFLMELISVIENIGCMNPAIGEKMVDVLGIDPGKVNLGKVKEESDGID